jgi:hypothetical protein
VTIGVLRVIMRYLRLPWYHQDANPNLTLIN